MNDRKDSALRDAYWSLRAAADRAIEVAFQSSADAGGWSVNRTALRWKSHADLISIEFSFSD